MNKTKKQIISEGFDVSFTNGTGAGGQKRNRTYSVAIVKHINSGITEKCDETRNANKNMNIAYNKILKKIEENKIHQYEKSLNDARKKAIENGTIRTYNFKTGIVKNHLNGKTAPLKKVLNGNLDIIK